MKLNTEYLIGRSSTKIGKISCILSKQRGHGINASFADSDVSNEKQFVRHEDTEKKYIHETL